MTKKNFSISPMTRQELNTAIEWAANEGWNPGLYDGDSFFSADNSGFLAGRLNGKIISTISAVKYGSDFGFIGFYIVDPAYRDQGYGYQTWLAAMAYLSGRNIGLDGVVDQQHNYKKSGFNLAYRNIRYQGVGTGEKNTDRAICPITPENISVIKQYDQTLFPSNRSDFLDQWLQQPNSVAIAIIDNDTVLGYSMLRPCQAGYKIGPLFADTATLADQLLTYLLSYADKGEAVYIDPPECNSEAIKLVESKEMNVVFETARMYTGEAPSIALEKTFGVTSFELG